MGENVLVTSVLEKIKLMKRIEETGFADERQAKARTRHQQRHGASIHAVAGAVGRHGFVER